MEASEDQDQPRNPTEQDAQEAVERSKQEMLATMNQLEQLPYPKFAVTVGEGEERKIILTTPFRITERGLIVQDLDERPALWTGEVESKVMDLEQVNLKNVVDINYDFFIVATKDGFKGLILARNANPSQSQEPSVSVSAIPEDDLIPGLLNNTNKFRGALGLGTKEPDREYLGEVLSGQVKKEIQSLERPVLKGMAFGIVDILEPSIVAEAMKENIRVGREKYREQQEKIQGPIKAADSTIEAAKSVQQLLQDSQ